MAIDYGNGYRECNLEKYKCFDCGNQFILGTEMLNGKKPLCPYCGSWLSEKIVWTDNEKLEELDLGCLSLIQEIVTDSDTEIQESEVLENGRI